jgi:5,10-methylenetetrahydromethanopterin reductase
MATRPPLSFGIRFPPCETPQATAAFAQQAEDAGFDWIWAVDSPLLAGALFDPYVDLAVCAQHTRRARLGPAVSPLGLRSPVATAAAILSLDRISGGRAVLGLGSGGSALVTLGVARSADLTYTSGARARQDQLHDEVVLLRRLLAGEPVSLGTRDIQLERPSNVKIYLAASGPRMLELAGALADGVIIHVGIWPPAVRDAVARVRRGAEQVGRDPDTLDYVCSTYTAVSADGDRAQDIRYVRPEASFFYSIMPQLVEEAGFDVTRRFPERMPRPDMTHAYDWEEAMAAAETYIPDAMVEQFCLVGPVSAAIDRIRHLADLGITQLYVRGATSYRLPVELVSTFARAIIPRFARRA